MGERQFKIYWALYPLAIIYRIVTGVRNKLFDWGVLKSRRFGLPVICVGNISVGGTGKTPHTEYLVRLLLPLFRVATLSRGYMRKSRGFVMVDGCRAGTRPAPTGECDWGGASGDEERAGTRPAPTGESDWGDASGDEERAGTRPAPTGGVLTMSELIGDEPYQLLKKFSGLTVAVDGNRCRGISRIMDGVDVILLDDAYQHRYVKAGVTILLIDYNRPIWDDVLLPAGRLRESASGKRRADIVIVSKCPKDMGEEEMLGLRKKVGPCPGQLVFFSTLLYNNMYRLSDKSPRSLDSITSADEILLVTGIASPAAIMQELKKRTNKIRSISFPDHHAFSQSDTERIKKVFSEMNQDRGLIVTTEKDAARFEGRDVSKESIYLYIYILPIEVGFLNDEGKMFNQKIIEYVRENTRDSGVYPSADAHTS